MDKKIVEVPEGVTRIALLKNNRVVFDAINISVSDLPDAPKKQVIELPKDLLEKLTTEKENADNVYVFFGMEKVTEIMDWLSLYLPAPYNLEPENIAADWYLGHVEFVAEKEQKFYVKVDRPKSIYVSFIGSAIGKKTVEFWKIPQEVTEEEADELVAGLTALNARKVKVE